jgi:hypothetical protein
MPFFFPPIPQHLGVRNGVLMGELHGSWPAIVTTCHERVAHGGERLGKLRAGSLKAKTGGVALAIVHDYGRFLDCAPYGASLGMTGKGVSRR